MTTHYQTLGVSPDAEPEVIQAAYRALMRKYHPDSGQSPSVERAQAINTAYDVVSDPARRAEYDARLRPPARQASSTGFAASSALAPVGGGGSGGWIAWTVVVLLVIALITGLAITGVLTRGGRGLTPAPAPEAVAAETAAPAATDPTPPAAPAADASPAPAEPAAPASPDVPGSVDSTPTPAPMARPNLSGLTASERASVESACSGAKLVEGPAAYYRCVSGQLTDLEALGGARPNLAGLNATERQSIQSACSGQKLVEGPAAYYRCVFGQLQQLGR